MVVETITLHTFQIIFKALLFFLLALGLLVLVQIVPLAHRLVPNALARFLHAGLRFADSFVLDTLLRVVPALALFEYDTGLLLALQLAVDAKMVIIVNTFFLTFWGSLRRRRLAGWYFWWCGLGR